MTGEKVKLSRRLRSAWTASACWSPAARRSIGLAAASAPFLEVKVEDYDFVTDLNADAAFFSRDPLSQETRLAHRPYAGPTPERHRSVPLRLRDT